MVFNTIQMYRKDALRRLKEARRRAKADGYVYAVKLVRGAYMEKERERAAKMGYPSPIHETKAEVDADYDAAMEYCVRHFKDMAFVAATHNEQSTNYVAQLMHEYGIAPNHPH